MNACKTCVWAKLLPEAGPAPKKPDPPKNRLLRLLWTDPADDIWSDYYWAASLHATRARHHCELISCRRFPTPIDKFKTDVCGEWKAP
jgi:hypothetical protein